MRRALLCLTLACLAACDERALRREAPTAQVNTTAEGTLPDGSSFTCSDTTVLETVLNPALPMVLMGDGVYQTQWVINIRQLTNSHFFVGDPENPDAEFDMTTEILSQMTWTLLTKEVDIDGDGLADEFQISGANSIELLEQNVTGQAPEGAPAPPPLQLPFELQGVLQVSDAPTPDADAQPQ